MAYRISTDNYREAESAIRDILFMYRDLISSYSGFGHGIDTGTFAPTTFVDAELDEESGYSLGIDLQLLHQGAAVALLCELSDFWDEEGAGDLGWSRRWRGLVNEGRSDHLPLAKMAVLAGLESEDKFRALLPTIYNEYVLGYFRRLLGE